MEEAASIAIPYFEDEDVSQIVIKPLSKSVKYRSELR